MLTEEDDVEIHALAARGWSVSAISRHTGRDRKTVRTYLAAPSVARAVAPSCLEPYRAYIAARFDDDRHLEATVLHRELLAAGFERAYTTLVGELRRLELRPVCLVCAHRRGDQVTTEIDIPPVRRSNGTGRCWRFPARPTRRRSWLSARSRGRL